MKERERFSCSREAIVMETYNRKGNLMTHKEATNTILDRYVEMERQLGKQQGEIRVLSQELQRQTANCKRWKKRAKFYKARLEQT